MDISLTIYIIKLNFFVNILNVLLEGSVSQISYLGPSFSFMIKNGYNFLSLFSIPISTFHKIKTKT